MARKTSSGKVTVRAQRSDGADEALIKLVHMAMPWAAWAGLTVAVNLGLFAFRHTRGFAALGCAILGLVIAFFDCRLRSHRASWEGRWIGPVTAASGGLLSGLYLLAGFSQDLALAYLVLGMLACVCWDIWITVGDHRDMAATFNAKAAAAGVDGARMVEVSRRPASAGWPGQDDDEPAPPRRPRRPRRSRGTGRAEVVEVGLVLPSDPAMDADEVGDRMRHAEVVTRSRPGSMALVSDPDDSGLARVRVTDPELLTAHPLPWPGPSAPGADMSAPFRLSLLQTGEPFAYNRLPVHHIRVTGKTGSGKTMSLAYNMFGEGITRTDYSAWAADVVKGEQFLGALRPALHGLALDPGAVHLLLKRLHRARLDRCNFLGRNHHTEWFPGCGLVAMDCWLEEAAGILKQLGTTRGDKADGLFMLEDWVEDVNAARSAGMWWTASYQKPDKTQAFSTVARSQMGHVCFAVADKKDYEFGLSDLQRERGCRPVLWDNPDSKGMALFDTETVDEETKVTPMRFWDWGPGSGKIAAHASEYQARDRPLDDVTGEAMTWDPPVSPSSAFPQAAGNGTRAYDNSGVSPKQRSMLAAEEKTRKQLAQWLAEGKDTVAVVDLDKMSGHIGKARTWYYTTLRKFEGYGWLEDASGDGKQRWAILPAIAGKLHAVDDLPEQDEGDVPA